MANSTQAVRPERPLDCAVRRCDWLVTPGNGLTTVTPAHACTRRAGHGPGGAYCWQHARQFKAPNEPAHRREGREGSPDE